MYSRLRKKMSYRSLQCELTWPYITWLQQEREKIYSHWFCHISSDFLVLCGLNIFICVQSHNYLLKIQAAVGGPIFAGACLSPTLPYQVWSLFICTFDNHFMYSVDLLSCVHRTISFLSVYYLHSWVDLLALLVWALLHW